MMMIMDATKIPLKILDTDRQHAPKEHHSMDYDHHLCLDDSHFNNYSKEQCRHVGQWR